MSQALQCKKMAPAGHFSVADRVREKQEARARAEHCILSGEASSQQIAEANGFFSSLDPSRVHIVRRRAEINIAA